MYSCFLLNILKDFGTPVVTLIIAYLLYRLYQKNHLELIKQQKILTRFSTIRQLNNELINIFSEKTALETFKENGEEKKEEREFRYILDQKPYWVVSRYEPDNGIIHVIYKGQRYWQIRNYEDKKQYVSSKALQETLFWFRMAYQGLIDSVIQPSDLCELWRSIFPLSSSGRFNYFKEYFGDFEIENDLKIIALVVNATLDGCKIKKYNNAIKYLCDCMSEQEKNIMPKKYCDIKWECRGFIKPQQEA
jgi:hypothetical protein